jgi:acetylglutamate kinase
MQDISILKQSLPYLQKYRDKLFVIKIGGEIVQDRGSLEGLAEAITLLHLVGIRIIVVHGGGPQASELSKKLGQEPKIVDGRRITDDQTLDVTKMVFAGKINIEILSALRKFGRSAVGLSGVAAGIIHAVKRKEMEVTDPETGRPRMIDFGHVGDITDIDGTLLRDLVERHYIPVITSLGSDSEGNVLNINADTVASAIARKLQAAKLILMTNVDGVLEERNGQKRLISTLTTGEAKAEIEQGTIRGGMLPKIQACLSAIDEGVHRAHILNGFDPQALLTEIFTKKGCGTMITSSIEEDAYQRELRFFSAEGAVS